MDEQKRLLIGDELINSIKDKLPSHANISSCIDHRRDSYVAYIYWKLNDDEARPNKPSRKILIIISGEAMDDSNYDKRSAEVVERFKRYIDSKIKHFNPKHYEPYGKSPPVEEWLIDNRSLNF